MKSLIQKLVETTGPSGFETQIRELIRNEVEPLADETRVDNLGNLISRFGKRSDGGLRIVLMAHMDEIGLMATHIDERGYVRFTPIGGVLPLNCLGGRVRFLDNTYGEKSDAQGKSIPGVIGAEKLSDASRAPTFEQMFIDVGASSRKDCPIRVGEVAAFERPFLDLGKRLVAKSMDDRVGVAILIETLRRLSQANISCPHQVYFVFTTQEEVGVRGATAAAFGIDPELGLAVDVTLSGDTPNGMRMEVSLGAGPAIKVRDQGMLADPRVVRWMASTASQQRIPHQMEVLERGGTDAKAIQLTRSGVPAGCLSIPCRYLHTPSEMVDYTDVQNAVELLSALLQGPVDLG
jgi:putative aminopeptidase FrvX